MASKDCCLGGNCRTLDSACGYSDTPAADVAWSKRFGVAIGDCGCNTGIHLVDLGFVAAIYTSEDWTLIRRITTYEHITWRIVQNT